MVQTSLEVATGTMLIWIDKDLHASSLGGSRHVCGGIALDLDSRIVAHFIVSNVRSH